MGKSCSATRTPLISFTWSGRPRTGESRPGAGPERGPKRHGAADFELPAAVRRVVDVHGAAWRRVCPGGGRSKALGNRHAGGLRAVEARRDLAARYRAGDHHPDHAVRRRAAGLGDLSLQCKEEPGTEP